MLRFLWFPSFLNFRLGDPVVFRLKQKTLLKSKPIPQFGFTNYQALSRRSSSTGFRFQTFSNPWVEQVPHLLPDYLKGVRIFESLKEPFNSEMEPCSKPIVTALSITQIVMSVAFFLLGMVDRFYVKFAYTSFTFLPCWIFPLVRNIFKGNINR